MPKQSEFAELVIELLEDMQGVMAKRMFGGFGIFKDGMMFALISDDTLYFKADDFNRFEFERLDLPKFVYHKGGKPMSMDYYKAPESTLDNSDAMLHWAQSAFDAALRATAKKKKK